MVIERLLFFIVFYLVFTDENDSTTTDLESNIIIRFIIFDIVIPLGFTFIALTFAFKNKVVAFPTLSLACYIFIGLMVLSTILNVSILLGSALRTEFRVMLAAVFTLTELFNSFLVFVYVRSAQSYISIYISASV